MAKLTITCEFKIDDILPIFSEDIDEIDWVYNDVLDDNLIVHSNVIGDIIGSIKIIEINEGHLVCNQCGKQEEKPFDIGDNCLCGGYFIPYLQRKDKDHANTR